MKTREEVSADKLRGGFYSPPQLVEVCLRRLAGLARGRSIRLLEPSAGDGAFIRGLHAGPLRDHVAEVTAVEPLAAEAERTRSALGDWGVASTVVTGSAIEWSLACDRNFDAAVGNPPFVRFQFVSAETKQAAIELMSRLGLPFRGVSNLWVPVLLAALHRLRGCRACFPSAPSWAIPP